jgi:WD40 repeat protein
MVDGRQVHTLTGHSDCVNVVAFSPDGNRVVSGSDDRLVKIWDTETGAEVCNFVGVR